jgi:hypothetical protein
MLLLLVANNNIMFEEGEGLRLTLVSIENKKYRTVRGMSNGVDDNSDGEDYDDSYGGGYDVDGLEYI